MGEFRIEIDILNRSITAQGKNRLNAFVFGSLLYRRGHKWLTAGVFFPIFVGNSGLNPKQTTLLESFVFPFDQYER